MIADKPCEYGAPDCDRPGAIKEEGIWFCAEHYDYWCATWELFGRLDDPGKEAVSSVLFADIPGDSVHHRRLRKLGYGQREK